MPRKRQNWNGREWKIIRAISSFPFRWRHLSTCERKFSTILTPHHVPLPLGYINTLIRPQLFFGVTYRFHHRFPTCQVQVGSRCSAGFFTFATAAHTTYNMSCRPFNYELYSYSFLCIGIKRVQFIAGSLRKQMSLTTWTSEMTYTRLTEAW